MKDILRTLLRLSLPLSPRPAEATDYANISAAPVLPAVTWNPSLFVGEPPKYGSSQALSNGLGELERRGLLQRLDRAGRPCRGKKHTAEVVLTTTGRDVAVALVMGDAELAAAQERRRWSILEDYPRMLLEVADLLKEPRRTQTAEVMLRSIAQTLGYLVAEVKQLDGPGRQNGD